MSTYGEEDGLSAVKKQEQVTDLGKVEEKNKSGVVEKQEQASSSEKARVPDVATAHGSSNDQNSLVGAKDTDEEKNEDEDAKSEESPIDMVQITAMVVMKIASHCNEAAPRERCEGALLGIINGRCMEVTSCFPLPNDLPNRNEYMKAMMSHLARINVDNIHVGWYQPAGTSFLIKPTMLTSQRKQDVIKLKEAVIITFSLQMSDFNLDNFRAYRLTSMSIDLINSGRNGTDLMRKAKIGNDNLFVEVPISLKVTPLQQILLHDLVEKIPEKDMLTFVAVNNLPRASKQMRTMVKHTDDFSVVSLKEHKYKHQLQGYEARKKRLLTKMAAENEELREAGKPLITEKEALKKLDPLPAPPQMVGAIIAGEIKTRTKEVENICKHQIVTQYLKETLPLALEKVEGEVEKDDKKDEN